MKYLEFKEKTSFNLEELIALSYRQLVDDPPDNFDARLPAPPFLMVDRILKMEKNKSRGKIIAEQDIRLDAWYFQCHFPGDPVQPGCLCVDAIWQLMGFYCVWRGALGAGRALGCEEVAFNGQIRPYNKIVVFDIDIIRYSELKRNNANLIIANATVAVDGEIIATVQKARTGVFKGITYNDYPRRSKNSIGGIIERNV
jgi:3-hydroxyacyl-[acyl-carrier protein] dehydratase/trans-2-decenoyl-[acyl-carrier protein] isomerase